MLGKIVVMGASAAGCKIALAAQAAGHDVTLVDEHPQAMKDMSFDAPWFYGAALPSALLNDNSIAQAVLEAAMGCKMRYEPAAASWVPEVSATGESSLENVLSVGDEASAAAVVSCVGGAQHTIGPPASAAAKWVSLDSSPEWRTRRNWQAGQYNT
ncbi:NAD-binding protein [Sinorhizobium meliloti]|uniref:NAD-binding protein n=1 Tax=Rhizobium meliloti TaxID=382 RepID=UPI003F181036